MRPHPWGLLVVFIELIQNDKYRFWQHDFVQCAPEIERLVERLVHCFENEYPPFRLFINVADSCRINLQSKLGSNGRTQNIVPT